MMEAREEVAATAEEIGRAFGIDSEAMARSMAKIADTLAALDALGPAIEAAKRRARNRAKRERRARRARSKS